MPKILLPGFPGSTSKVKLPVPYLVNLPQYQPDDPFFIHIPIKRTLIGSVVYPFAGMRTTLPASELLSARYRKDGGGWNTITKGAYSDLLQAILFFSETQNDFGTFIFELELTDVGSVVHSAVGSIIVGVIGGVAKTARTASRFRPFADVKIGDPSQVSKIEYSVQGATPIGRKEILPPLLFQGLHTGANNNANLIDSSANFLNTRIRAGIDIVKNVTDGSQAVITSVLSSTEIVGTLAGGTENDWDTNDNYEIVDGDNIALRAQKFALETA